MINKLLSIALYMIATGVGMASFLYPFFTTSLEQQQPLSQVRAGETPLMYSLLLGICVLVLLFEVQSQAVDTKLIAMLGMLVAINSVLRFIEVAIPGPGGFSPIFFLIILVGYVYGARLGFVMGALTLFASAIITGGVGPWLPSQMFTAGWVGMSAPVVRWPVRVLGAKGRLPEVILLALFGAGWGFLYGAVMNLWSWPFIAGPADQNWAAGIGLVEALQRYGLYYLVTSLIWDASRAFGNFFLIMVAGSATLRALRRFEQRFSFSYQPSETQTGFLEP
jgi:energy-coupling factor transport system substrate-specific component